MSKPVSVPSRVLPEGVSVTAVLPGDEMLSAPFRCTRISLAPGVRSPSANHHEAELWAILAGSGRAELDGSERELRRGDVLLIPPLTQHAAVTASDSALEILSAYWGDTSELSRQHGIKMEALTDLKSLRRIIIPAIATPNGELHLGHLAGPFLAADVFKRAIECAGGSARLCLGTLGHQDHIAVTADRLGKSYYESAEQFTDAIKRTFDEFSVGYDVFLRATPANFYLELMQDIFRVFREKGLIVPKETLVNFNPETEKYCVEAFVEGLCPHCGHEASGNDCEGCGRFHDDAELREARCALTGVRTVQRPLLRWHFRMELLRDQLTRYYESARFQPQVAAYARWVMSHPLPDVPVTHFCREGVPVLEPGFEGQRMFATFEHAGRYLTAVQQLAEQEGVAGGFRGYLAARRVGLTILFGNDNAFPRIVLTPALLLGYLGSDWLPNAMFMNHFYLLDNFKFSTGRRHAVWGREVPERTSIDAMRLFLCFSRPEVETTSFTWEKYHEFCRSVVTNEWLAWLRSVDQRLREAFDGRAPEAGAWLAHDLDFFAEIERLSADLARHYSEALFSSRLAAHRLHEFVLRARQYHADSTPWPRHEKIPACTRTQMALELSGVLCFAQFLEPIAPGWARALLSSLGAKESPRWTPEPRWVPAGTGIEGLSTSLSLLPH